MPALCCIVQAYLLKVQVNARVPCKLDDPQEHKIMSGVSVEVPCLIGMYLRLELQQRSSHARSTWMYTLTFVSALADVMHIKDANAQSNKMQ